MTKPQKNIIDENREGPSLLKFVQLFKLFIPKNTRTLLRLKKFENLDLQKLNKITGLQIKALIVDCDDCISYNHGAILEENISHLKKLLKQGTKIVIYSNMKHSARYDVLPAEIKVLTNLKPKPDVDGFKKAIRSLGVDKKHIAMVGDNYITDAGCLYVGIPFIKVKPIETIFKNWEWRSIMKIYGWLREFYNIIALFYDRFRSKPLTEKDLR